jgi:urease accessory protein
MKRIIEVIAAVNAGPAIATLTLAFDDRRKSRQRVHLDGGEEAALLLPRGTVLRDGDRLRTEGGELVEVRAAPEELSSVTVADPLALARAAYHLGNRHVPVQIDAGKLRYQHDHVLDDMVRALGLPVHTEHAPFQPEGGAYGHGHGHGQDHDHDHGGHDHDHDHHGHHHHDHDHD